MSQKQTSKVCDTSSSALSFGMSGFSFALNLPLLTDKQKIIREQLNIGELQSS